MAAISLDPKAELVGILGLEENSKCADCDTQAPTWVSVNNQVFICTACAGVHRSLGVEYSFVQSVLLDEWTQETVNSLKGVSTSSRNVESLEYAVPEGVLKINEWSSRAQRERYIKMKYVERSFAYEEGKVARKPLSAVRDTSSSAPATKSVGEIEFVGVVRVQILSARDLIKADIIGKSDPYVVITLGRQRFKTKVVKCSLNPNFNEAFMFSWNSTDKLMLHVWDEDLTNDDGTYFSFSNTALSFTLLTVFVDPLGDLVVDLSRFENGISTPVDELLQNIEKGSIQFVITVDILGH